MSKKTQHPTSQSPDLKAPVSLIKKIFAVLLFLAVAGVFYYLTHLPIAHPLDSSEIWKASVDDELVWMPLEPSTFPLLEVQGADQENIDVHLENGVLNAVTIQALQQLKHDFGLAIPATLTSITRWQTKVTAKGGGRTLIDIGLKAKQGIPELHITHVGDGAHPGLSIFAKNAELKVDLSVLLGDNDTGEQKTLETQEGKLIQVPGTLPISLTIPENKKLTMIFPSDKPASSFHLGSSEEFGGQGLWLRYMGLRRAGGSQNAVCAAKEHDLFLWPRDLGAEDCLACSSKQSAQAAACQKMKAIRLGLSSEAITVSLAGSAFVVRDGKAETDAWFKQLQDNPVIAALLGMAFSALATWVWKLF